MSEPLEAALTGELIIAGAVERGGGAPIRGLAAATGQPLEPAFDAANREQLNRACEAAEAAFDAYRATSSGTRAAFLERIADNLRGDGEAIVTRCLTESGLPRGRLDGELDRTINQLKLFAGIVRDGYYLDLRIDPALPDRVPAPRPDLRLRNIPVGPVAVFGASNFPLAFSVAGGDTASALAAGCPVVVKAHNAHPGTSELVGRALTRAVSQCGLPAGVFSLLFGQGSDIGAALVDHPAIKAVGFTGSRSGGTALMKIAQARPEPIPVYAEMSSINPVVLLAGALADRGAQIGAGFAGALTLGAGQFCTNPGLVLAVDGPGLDAFVHAASQTLAQCAAATMLTPQIHGSYVSGVKTLADHASVDHLASGLAAQGPHEGVSAFFSTSATTFLGDPKLHAEIFGSTSLLVKCRDPDELRQVMETIEGQLTIAVHMTDADAAAARDLLPLIERKAGRIVFNGFGTGVEVGHAMVHGGPYPSTSDGRTTSVGGKAIERFLRPVSYQDAPQALLPPELRDGTPAQPILRDGKR